MLFLLLLKDVLLLDIIIIIIMIFIGEYQLNLQNCQKIKKCYVTQGDTEKYLQKYY